MKFESLLSRALKAALVSCSALSVNLIQASDLQLNEIDALIDKPGGEWLEGEHYDPLKGVFTIRQTDFSIPGDGPDLVVVRDHEGILEPSLVEPGTRTNFCAQGSGRDYVANPLQNVPNDRFPVFDYYGKKVHFFPINRPNTLFPNSAILASPDNWYIECVNNAISMKSPSGFVFSFGVGNVFFDGRVRSITDSHGNSLQYNWIVKSYSDSDDRTHLQSIVASDGRQVNISYGTFNGKLTKYEEADGPNPRKVTVSFDGDVSTFTNPDGTFWQYVVDEDGLKQIRSPSGQHVTYTMQEGNKSDYLGDLLSSDPMYQARNTKYHYHTQRVLSSKANQTGTWTLWRSTAPTTR